MADKPGRPSLYTEELAQEICELISEGHSLRNICQREGMPHRSTVLNWQNDNPEFSARCARAREGQADWLSDEMADIEDGVLSGQVDPQAARVVLSSKQWRAAKLAPKKYGDKVTQEISGVDGGPIKTQEEPNLDGLNKDDIKSLLTIARKSSKGDSAS